MTWIDCIEAARSLNRRGVLKDIDAKVYGGPYMMMSRFHPLPLWFTSQALSDMPVSKPSCPRLLLPIA